MNSTEEEKDNSKCLEKIILLFLNLFFSKLVLPEGGRGDGAGTPSDVPGISVSVSVTNPNPKPNPKIAFFKKRQTGPDRAFY